MLVVAKPWRMTRRSFYSKVGTLPAGWEEKGWNISDTKTDTKIVRTKNHRLYHLRGKNLFRPFNPVYHRECVIRALERGQKVPKRVLRDYSGLIVGRKSYIHLFCGKKFWTPAALQKHLDAKNCTASTQTRACAEEKERIRTEQGL